MQGDGKRIVRNIRAMFMGQLITWTISLVWSIYLPRYIGATNMGRLAIATAIWAVMSSIINTGTSTHLTTEIARYPQKATELLGTALIQRYLIFLVCCFLVIPYVYIMQYSRETIILICIVAATMPAANTITTLNAVFQGREIMQYISIIDIFSKGLTLILSFVFMWIGLGVNEIVAITIVVSGLAVAIQIFILRQYMPLRFTCNRVLFFDMLRRSRPYFAGSMILVVYCEVDKLIMPTMVDEQTVGWFSIAASLAGTMIFIPSILTTAIFPALARGATQAGDSASRILQKSLDVALITGVPIGLGLAIVSEPLVELLYQSKFPQSGPVLSVMSIMLIFTYISTVVARLLIASGRANTWSIAMIVGIVLAIPLNFVLVPWTEQTFGNGAIGVALRLLFTEFLMAVFALWLLPRGTLTRDNARTACRIFVAGGIMAAASWSVRDMFIAIPVLVGVVTYVFMIVVLRVLKPEDIDMAATAIRDALGGSLSRAQDSSAPPRE